MICILVLFIYLNAGRWLSFIYGRKINKFWSISRMWRLTDLPFNKLYLSKQYFNILHTHICEKIYIHFYHEDDIKFILKDFPEIFLIFLLYFPFNSILFICAYYVYSASDNSQEYILIFKLDLFQFTCVFEFLSFIKCINIKRHCVDVFY